MCQRIMGWVISIAASMALVLSPVEAQTMPEEGATVRISVPALGLERHEGTLLRVGVDSLRVGATVVAVKEITRFEVARKRRNVLKGAAIGFAGGALVLGTWCALTCGETSDLTVGDIALMHAGVGAGGGLVLGTLIGALTPRTEWERIPLPVLAPVGRSIFR